MARFYYSVGGRYSYLASTQMAKFDSGPYDWDYRRLDAERWADYYGVPYEEPRGAVHSDPELARSRAWRRTRWGPCAPTARACSRPSSWTPFPR
jgi:2-hydroxychromene-2-carboxylate isomerase